MNTPITYTPAEILAMRPATLRYALSRRLAIDESLSKRIAELCGFNPRWYRLGTVELAAVAIAWAICVSDNPKEIADAGLTLVQLTKLVKGASK
jgi:hypothetical protein